MNFLNRYKNLKWVPPVGAFISFLIPVVIGSIIQAWYDKSSINKSSLLLFSLSIILALLVFIILAMHRSMSSLIDKLDILDSKIGIQISYVENDETGQVYRACNPIIKSAKESIYVVNSFVSEMHEFKGHENTQKELLKHKNNRGYTERINFYKLLLKKGKDEEIDYVRIVQTGPSNEPLVNAIKDKLHFDHLCDMIDCRKNTNCRTINLLKAPARRLNTFILVDKKHLIWQINEVSFSEGQKDGKLSLQGVFIFNDPQKTITHQFQLFFDKLRTEAIGPINHNDLNHNQ